uniref:Twinkle homolog proteinic/mitochondrial n=2 Tax=Rhizophora mucronata TaxID=61149 RepID=A0A2P2L9A9_RHIMU
MLRFASYNPDNNLRKLVLLSSSSSLLHLHMGSKFLLKPSTLFPAIPSASSSFSSSNRNFHRSFITGLFPVFCSKPTSRIHPSFLKTNGLSYTPLPSPVHRENMGKEQENLEILRRKLEEMGVYLDPFAPGQYNGLICPRCKGGDSEEKSFALFVSQDGSSASWICFRAKCGWTGGTRPYADSKSMYRSLHQLTKVKQIREITEQGLGLEPLCDELLGYFKERLISAETLRRNGVMQKSDGNQIAIAFPYRRDGVFVNCKYRDINKRFWQEKDTEKIFYGLDDIKKAEDIIIVEGEIDKLSMEEAGFRNCVSVPDGAPPSISKKELPPEDKVIVNFKL